MPARKQAGRHVGTQACKHASMLACKHASTQAIEHNNISVQAQKQAHKHASCLLYTSPSPRD
eukprot:2698583-Alexandrium_andersonii.AAC.1